MKAEGQHKGEHQNIARASAVLEVLAEASDAGVRLKDIIDSTGLNNAAVFRVLNGLVQHGLAEQDRATGRFVLGVRLLTWVKRAGPRFKLEHIARDSIVRLAAETEDTVYLSVRSNNELVLIDRKEGSFPIKTLTLEVGARRPLGVSAGGMALLSYLPDAEIAEIVRINREDGIEYPSDEDNLWERIRAAREAGFVYYDSSVIRGSEVIGGVTAISMPIRDAQRRPMAAISVTALTERLQKPRQDDVVDAIRKAVDEIQRQLA